MRILAAIPHYFDRERLKTGELGHGSLSGNADARVEALASCVSSLHQLFGGPQVAIEIATLGTIQANAGVSASRVDVLICTTKGRHLLPSLPLSDTAFRHCPTDAEPGFLGFECHAALQERLGDYDYYCYLEDDLVLHDPWFFAKLGWFQGQVGPASLLMPNRFEVSRSGVAWKAYVDGTISRNATANFQNLSLEPEKRGICLGVDLRFVRPTNPHSGCFFLSDPQMRAWSSRTDFLDRDARFIGPLESAATLGVMRAFRIYKPAPEVANFLEIEHAGKAFIHNLRRR